MSRFKYITLIALEPDVYEFADIPCITWKRGDKVKKHLHSKLITPAEKFRDQRGWCHTHGLDEEEWGEWLSQEAKKYAKERHEETGYGYLIETDVQFWPGNVGKWSVDI